MTWIKGKTNVIWDDCYKSFEYINQPLTNEELETWREQGYTHENFTGLMYDSRNPVPNWCYDVANDIGLKQTGFVFYKMKTNDIMPTHIDHFRRYCKVFNVERKDVWRAIVFLEDWKPGHYFEIERTAICNYKSGEYILWSCDAPHAASNIGIEDRYTLQITGIKSREF